MPSISCIVARSYPDYIIGSENKLPWHLKSDLRHFRDTTSDHVVIMGRKTYESIGRPLPNRVNIILSRENGNNGPNLHWVKNRENALFLADIMTIMRGKSHFFIIGGSQIYATFEDLVNRIHLTEVYTDSLAGDAYFDQKFDYRKWRTVEERSFPKSSDDQYPFTISLLERRIKTVRQHHLSYFLTEKGDAVAEATRTMAAKKIIELQPAIQLELADA